MADKIDLIGLLQTETGKAAIAGFLGGVVRWITLRRTLAEGILTVLVGGICAVYLGPIAVPIVEKTVGVVFPGGDASGLGFFLVGLGGMTLTGILVDAFESRRRSINREEEEK